MRTLVCLPALGCKKWQKYKVQENAPKLAFHRTRCFQSFRINKKSYLIKGQFGFIDLIVATTTSKEVNIIRDSTTTLNFFFNNFWCVSVTQQFGAVDNSVKLVFELASCVHATGVLLIPCNLSFLVKDDGHTNTNSCLLHNGFQFVVHFVVFVKSHLEVAATGNSSFAVWSLLFSHKLSIVLFQPLGGIFVAVVTTNCNKVGLIFVFLVNVTQNRQSNVITLI
mmetsp:Transcript_12548/g.20282  ORF Transcript_12548/g.20282 Transcript_12548/m.20282 type:complete len:223 (-) Transcript_12548:256-924(-)